MYTEAEKLVFIKTFKDNLCNISKSCKDFGLPRVTFYEWKNVDPDFKRQIEEAETETIEAAEQVLKSEGILKHNITALIFLLKNKHPEYREKLEMKTDLNLINEESKKLSEIINAVREKYRTDKAGSTNILPVVQAE